MSLVPDPDLDIREPDFREKFLYYLKNNARPKLSLKLMQVSRYFCFREFPYLVVQNLTYRYGIWKYLPLGKSGKYFIYNEDDDFFAHIDDDGLQEIDLNNLEKPLWITNKFTVGDELSSSQMASNIIPKLAVCHLKELYLFNQILTMEEFKFLVASKIVEDFTFYPGQVKYADGSIVPVDECVKLMPKLFCFEWSAKDMPLNVNPETTKNLIDYLNPSILKYFELRGISEDFDFTLFSKFMHKHPSIAFDLAFNGPPISENYSTMLQTYVNKLVESREYKTRRIMVYFRGQNEKYYTILEYHFKGIKSIY